MNLVPSPKIFLSTTDLSEEGMSETEKRAQTDPQLLEPMPVPDLSSVLSFWGKVQEIS